MAPFGSYILQGMNVEWMLRGVVILNVAQLLYFNINKPSVEKLIASGAFCIVLMVVFASALSRLAKKSGERDADTALPEPGEV